MNFNSLIESIKAMTVTASDDVAVKAIDLYPIWRVGESLAVGDRRQHNGKLYKVKTQHITQSDWEPGIETASLFEVIDIEHSGALDDPIPYDVNIEVFNGKYYSYNDVIYLCIRDSGQPLYTTPDALLNNYFEIV